jgi:hypothetical protein
MANKQIDELTELTTASGTDHMLVYDTNEAGSEKTKRMSVEAIVGGWILVQEFEWDNEAPSESFSWDGEAYPEIRIVLNLQNNWMKVHFNADTGENYLRGLMTQTGTTPVAQYVAMDGLWVGATGAVSYCTVEGNMKQTGYDRVFSRSQSQYSSSNTTMIGEAGMSWNNTADPVTSISLGVGSSGNVTGSMKIYRWNDVRIT